ncbi:SET domain [Ostreococcus tauri]|uniref:SET domain n=1 Tax=Ostreococcus tauri TaxID=70448 RepID=A0A090M1H3_OSTTA|nr:SET domain [Ostreococcus tauri]CEF98036.1 SET domain [Ostreococcus tauri]|eukprot:XP_022839039.1 SET domain [Ostreococcus tauri]
MGKKSATRASDAAGEPSRESTASTSVEAFTSWCASKSIELNGVAVGKDRASGRGCVATRDLSVGEVVVRVPDEVVLTTETSSVRTELDAFVGDDGVESPRLEKELLVIAVMCEMLRGEKNSEWGAYLRVVREGAENGHSILAWDDEQAEALEGTDTWFDAYENDDEGLDLPTMTDEHWEHVVRLFFERNPELARGMDEDELRELHFAATAMVAGYSFTLGDDEIQGMVPFWDMLNHAPPCAASVRLNHDPKRGLQMITVREVKKGEEVFNTYGPLRNAELLRRYGFVLARNPHGGTTVGLDEVIEAAMMANPDLYEELPLRLAWLESRGLADEELSTRFFVHQTGRPSHELLITMRALILKPEEMTALIETDFEDEEQLMILEGNDETRAEQSYMVGAALQFLSVHANERYAISMKASRLAYKMYADVSPTSETHESLYREWAAALVRMNEQQALIKLGRWTYHPARSEDALLHAWPFPEDEDEDDEIMVCTPVEE